MVANDILPTLSVTFLENSQLKIPEPKCQCTGRGGYGRKTELNGVDSVKDEQKLRRAATSHFRASNNRARSIKIAAGMLLKMTVTVSIRVQVDRP